MKHSGRAAKSALKLVFWSLVLLLAVLSGGILAKYVSRFIEALAWLLIGLWGLFAAFTFYFFRDPTPIVPSLPKVVLSPGHGKVDVIDETTEPDFIGGPCRRISIFLSVIDIHVQNAPISAQIAHLKHQPGKFLSATKAHSADHNENILLGFASTEQPGQRIGLRLIAGLIARRIVPFVSEGDAVQRGDRISLIQFGSRCDLYLPLNALIQINLGDHVKGGETIVASFD
ncbi:MAG TPA: phosphatidylserine decarboxylase [Verrucomicrobiae bacterium]|jgi:phosphatidylserine decarboxylase